MLLFILAACSLLNDTYNTKHAIATVVRPSDTPSLRSQSFQSFHGESLTSAYYEPICCCTLSRRPYVRMKTECTPIISATENVQSTNICCSQEYTHC